MKIHVSSKTTQKAGKEIYSVRRRIAKDFIYHFGINILNAYGALEQMVRNSWDALASKVDILVAENKIIVRDNGFGITKNAINEIATLGGSSKNENPIVSWKSEERQTMGDKGVAINGLIALCSYYKLRSVNKEGQIVTYSDTFTPEYDSNKPLDFVIETVAEKDFKTGTEWKLFNIRQKIKVHELRNLLAEQMPLSDKFEITLNFEKIMPRSFADSTQYTFSSKNKYIGNIDFDVHIFKNGLKKMESFDAENQNSLYLNIGELKFPYNSLINISDATPELDGKLHIVVTLPLKYKKCMSYDGTKFFESLRLDKIRGCLLHYLNKVQTDYFKKRVTVKKIYLTSYDGGNI